MRYPIAVAAIGAFGLLSSGDAAAASFTPVNTRFSATGQVGLAQGQVGYTCTATFRGKTGKKGHAKITGVTLSGADPHCANTSATGLPWMAVATGASGGTMSRVGFVGAVGTCGPSQAAVMVDASGKWSFDDLLAPTCIFSGQVVTRPPITIAP